MEHGLDIGLIGRPFQEAPKGALRPLHGAKRARLVCVLVVVVVAVAGEIII